MEEEEEEEEEEQEEEEKRFQNGVETEFLCPKYRKNPEDENP